jgi:GT2 family glycosyltransferase
MADADVIYVNFNSTHWLVHSIETLLAGNQGKNLNIIVVDNSSVDNFHWIKIHFPEIKLIHNRVNVGFGVAVNQALAHCHSKYIILLNPDSMVTAGFFETCAQFLEQNDHIGILGPMILEDDGSIQGSARAFPTPLTSLFGRNSPLTKIFPNNSITRSNILTMRKDLESPMEVDWVSGACMVIRREVMEAVGGFDERFFLYWEDTDLCRRISDAGWKVVYFPGASVIHSVGKSSDTRPVFAKFQFHKSCYRLFDKYAKWPFSIFSPIAAISLMLRFSVAIVYGYIHRMVEKLKTQSQKNKSLQ